MGSPIRTRFVAQDSSIDRVRITVLLRDDATSGWLLSSPCTTTFSKMHLNKPRQDPLNPDTFSPYPGDLHRSDAVRSSRDRIRTIQIPRPQPQYTVFPVPPHPEVPHAAHQSWPQRSEPRVERPSRSRAYTAPSQARVNRPSNLNVCVPANNDIQYAPPTSNLFHSHRSAPPTPMVLPGLQQTDIMEQFISHFDEDDDDEEHKSVFGSFASRLRSRRGCSNASGSWGKKSGQVSLEKRKENPRKSLTELRDALKGCFGESK